MEDPLSGAAEGKKFRHQLLNPETRQASARSGEIG